MKLRLTNDRLEGWAAQVIIDGEVRTDVTRVVLTADASEVVTATITFLVEEFDVDVEVEA